MRCQDSMERAQAGWALRPAADGGRAIHIALYAPVQALHPMALMLTHLPTSGLIGVTHRLAVLDAPGGVCGAFGAVA